MSEVKHQPASLLPWGSRESLAGGKVDHVYSAGARNGATSMGCFRQGEDASYAIHAANAYQKLVGAVRNLLEVVNPDCRSADLARALLRDLGEAS